MYFHFRVRLIEGVCDWPMLATIPPLAAVVFLQRNPGHITCDPVPLERVARGADDGRRCAMVGAGFADRFP